MKLRISVFPNSNGCFNRDEYVLPDFYSDIEMRMKFDLFKQKTVYMLNFAS